MKHKSFLLLVVLVWAAPDAKANDWYRWRGPEQNGVSREKNLPESWSPNPKKANNNLIWKVPYGGRSTPIVMNGRIYLINDAESGITEQERVMCVNADTGEKLWEHRFNVFHTAIVSDRVGWSNVVGDPETGNVYAHGVEGLLFCFDKDGKILWSHSLTEEYGRFSGYGGRVTTPIIDEDLLIVSMINANWGEQARGGVRVLAVNKRTGEPVWWNHTGYRPKNTYYSCPVVAVINGERLLITGGGDGGVHAFKVRTGEKVWSYIYATGDINITPVIHGDLIYIGCGEESPDSNEQGRLICLDGSKVKDGKPTLVWGVPGVRIKFCSPIYHEGRIYACDLMATIYCFDAVTGKQLWSESYGRSAKGSPVWADGKIYLSSVEGKVTILKPGQDSCEKVHSIALRSRIPMEALEINGGMAVANGKIYFMTSQDLYCIGYKNAGAPVSDPIPPEVKEPAVDPSAKPTHLQILPADVVLYPGKSTTFRARVFDKHGRFLRDVNPIWSVAPALPPVVSIGLPPPPKVSPPPLKGKITGNGSLTVDKIPNGQFGSVVAQAEGLTGHARVRVAPTLPYQQDFEKIPVGAPPAGWVNAAGKFAVQEKDGSKVLAKLANNASPLLCRANTYIGMPQLRDYTIESDVMGVFKADNKPDLGIIANRYTLWLSGATQRLRLSCWDAIPRIDKTLDFPWKSNTWYRMKLTVSIKDGKGLVRGKIWERGQAEPKDWTITLDDPIPNYEGSPGLYGYAIGIETNSPGTPIYYDNVKITPNPK